MELAGVDKIRVARETLHGVVRCTPLKHFRLLEQRCSVPALVLSDNLPLPRSFKILVAYVRFMPCPPPTGRAVWWLLAK